MLSCKNVKTIKKRRFVSASNTCKPPLGFMLIYHLWAFKSLLV